MQFNKKEFKKVNDKKVMKKVKKQWVTVSISTLAFLGAAAVGTMMSLSDVSANDSVSAQSESSQSSVGVKEGSSNDGTLQGLSDKGDTNKNEDTATDASTPKNDNDALKNQSNNLNNNASQDLSTHNESHPIHVSNNLSVTQPDVHTDNKSGVPLNSEAKSGYIDGLNGSKNSADSNSDYSNAYGSAQTNKNVIDQAASDAYNNTNQVASSLSSNEQSLYNATSQGVNDARTQYNNGTSSFGTNEDYSSYNPSSAGSLNSSAATSYAHAQTKSYEDSLTSKYNNASNHSVRLQDGQTIVIPNSDSAQDTTYTADSDLDLAYKYGFNYFLAHQGYSDAESGKWTGTSDKNKGVAADNYNPSSDSTNPYDQAYLGAKNAMSKQWTYDATIVTPNSQTVTYTNGTITGYNNNIVNSNADKNNNYYNLGFNDVAKKVKNGNAFANNQYELNYLLTSIPVQKAINPGDKVEYAIINKNNPYGYSYNYFLNGLNKISIVNDIDFSNEASNTGNVYNYIYNSGGFNLTIDGQNHIADFSTLTTSFEHSGTLIEKNFKTTYSNNDYGVYKFENGGVDAGSLYLSNVNFIGSQILSATNTDVYISGSVNSINVKSINTPFEQNISVLNPDQENFEVNNLILAAGANFFGVTDKNSNSSVIHMYGNMTLGVGSNMTIIPRGSSGGSNANGAAYGIYMESSSTLSVNKNAILNIVPDYTSLDNNTAMASGIDSYGTINVTGGTINILVDGTPYNGGAEPIVNWSSSVININDGGSLNINVNDTNPSYGYDGTKGLIYSDGRINVYDGGNLRLTVQGGNRLTYILKQNTSNYLSVNNPGQIIFDSSTNTNTGNMVVYNQNAFNAYSVRYKIGSDSLSDPVYKFSYNTNGTNSNTYSYVDSNGQLSSTNQMSIPSGAAGPNYLEIDGVPSAYFVGPLDVEDDDNNDGGKKVTAYAKIRNYDPNASDSHVYVQYATGNNDTNYTGLNPIIDVWNYRNSIDSDHNMYDIVYDLKKNNYKDGQIIKIIFDIPASHMTGNNDVGVLMRYGVAGNSTVQNITSTSKGTDNYGNNLYGQYNQEAQNITSQNNGQSNQLVLDSNPNQTINIKNGWTSLFDTGTSDGINDGYFDDVINEKKNMVDYQRNIDYTRAYDSAKNGYNEFLNNTNEDLNTAISHAGDDVSSPISYIKGFEQAQQDVQKTRTAADTDARKNTNNYQNYYGQVRQIYLDEYNGLVIKDAINAAKSNFGDMVDETVGGSKYSSNEVAYKAYNDEYKSLADTAAQAKADYEGGKSSAAYSGANEDLYTSIYGAMSQAATDYNSGNGSNASGSHGYNSQIANYYTSAYTDLTNAASQASVDLGKNNGSDASYASGNSAASLAYSQAYSNVSSAAAQAKSDFQKSGQSLSHSYTTNSSAASTAYQAAYNAYSKAVSDFDGGSGSKQSSIAGYTSANYSAYASEYDALNKNAQDGSLAGFTSGASTSSSGDKAADTAYENAYNNAKQLVNNAYAIIDAEVKATKASIASDSRLDTAARSAQDSNVDSAATVAKGNINKATDAQGIEDAQSAGKTDIDKQYVPGTTSINDQQSAADAAMDAEVKATKASIASDSRLDTAARSAQDSNVDSAATVAKGNINKATDAQGIEDAQSAGKTDIDKQYVPGTTSINDQQSAADAAMDAEVKATKASIASDSRLDTAARSAQDSNVDSAATVAKGNINKATDAQGIEDAQSAGKTDIDKQYVPGTTSINDQQSAADAAMDAEVKATKASIASDSRLDTAARSAQDSNVDSAATVAKGNINKATDAQGIEDAQSAGKTDIDKQYVPGTTSINDQQSAADAAMDAEVKATKASIASDSRLDTAARSAQDSNVDSAATVAKGNINKATDAQGIEDAQSAGKTDIDKQYVPGTTSINDQQSAADAAMDAEVKATKASIASDSRLDTAARSAQDSNVDSAATVAKGNINKATDAQGIEDAQSAGKTDIDKQYVPGTTSINDQQSAADAAMDAEVKATKASIASDSRLDTAARSAQDSNVDSAATVAKGNINKATDAQGIEDAQSAGKTDIDKQYVPGTTSINDQQSAADAAMDAEVKATKASIASDSRLDTAARSAQDSNVDSAATVAKGNINKATDAQGIEDAQSAGKTDIDKQYVPGTTSINDQQSAADAAMDAEVKATKASIASDSRLDTAARSAQDSNVDSAATVAKGNINKATDAQGIEDAQSAGKTDIDKQYVPGTTSINDQQSAADAAMDAEVKATKASIASDSRLDTAARSAQDSNVDSAATVAKGNINKATDAQGIEDAQSAGKTDIDKQYVPGTTSINDQQSAADAAMDAEVKATKASIASDSRLDTAARSAQDSNVDSAATVAKGNINKATDAQGIEDAQSAGKTDIDKQYVPGTTSINDQQSAADAAMDAEVKATKASIASDSRLDTAARSAQDSNVDSAATVAKGNINKATDAQGIEDAQSAGKTDIDKQYVPGTTSINDQQSAADAAMDAEVKATKASIASDSRLDTAARSAQDSNVDSAATVAKGNINKATDAQGIEDAQSAGKTDIDKQYVPGTTSINDQQSAADAAMDAEVKATKASIASDSRLDTAARSAQDSNVDSAATVAKGNINKATDAQGIEDAQSAGKTDIDKQYVPGTTSINDQQSAADAAMDAEVKATKASIASDSRLDTAARSAQDSNVDSAATVAKGNINKATDAQGIEDAQSAGKTDIDKQYVPGTTSINDQQSAADAAMDAEVKATKASIASDSRLDTAARSAQDSNVDSAATVAKGNINKATDAQGIEDAQSAGKTDIDKQYVPGTTSINDQQSAADAAMDAEVKATKASIASDSRLDTAARSAQDSNVDSAATVAKGNINKATDAQGIEDAQSAGKTDIDKQYVPGTTSINDQQSAADAAMDAEVKATKASIASDSRLDTAARSAQDSNVDSAATVAKGNINKATDAQGIEDAQSAGKTDIDKQYVPGTTSINDQQSAADAAMDAEVKATKASIASDSRLDTAARSAQDSNVDSAATVAKGNINKATDAQGIEDAQSAGKTDIDKQYVPGTTSINDQQSAADAAMDAEVKATKASIASDSRLDTAARSAQDSNVDSAATVAKGNINKATDAQGIEDAQSAGKTDIDKQYVPGTTSINDQQSAADAAMDAEVKATKASIASDSRLDTAARSAQDSNVDSAATVAKGNINKATDAQGIEDAQSAGKTDIDKQYVPGTTSINDQQSAADAAMDAEVKATKASIASDSRLDTAARSAQDSNVDSAATVAKSNINKATDAQGIEDAQSAGKTDIDKQYVPGTTSINDQQSAADAAMDAEVKATKASIASDSRLDTAARSAQDSNVDSAATVAKGNINKATDAQGIEDAQSAGKTDIDKQYVPGTTSINDQQSAADAAMDAEVKATKASIASDSRLDTAARSAQDSNVDSAATVAKGNINKATDAQGIEDAQSAGKTDIDKQYVPGTTSINDQQSAADAAMDAEVKATKASIASDSRLDTAARSAQDSNVDSAATVAKSNINKATDAQGIEDAQSAGKTDIDKQYVPGTTSINDQQSAADAAMDAEVKATKASIASDSRLDTAARSAQDSNVDSAATVAKGNINKATDAQGIEDAQSAGKTDIDKQYVPGTTSINDQQSAADAAMDAEVKATKASIASDSRLDTAARSAQDSNADSAATVAKGNINKATDAQGIEDAQSAGKTDIDKQYVPGTTSINDQQSAADAAMDAEVKATKASIASDSRLDTAARSAQDSNVDSAATVAKGNINKATDAQGIEDAQSAGKTDIDKQYVPGTTSINDQQSAADSAMDAEVKATKASIASDSRLDTAARSAQDSNVDSAATVAKGNINKATDAQGIEDAQSAGKTDIDKQYVPGTTSINDQQSAADAAIDAEVAATKQKISDDNTLDTAAKNTQDSNVDSAATTAKANINKATDAQGIEDATNTGKFDIDKQYVPGTSLDSQQHDVDSKIDAEVAKVDSEIANDNNLYSDDKDKQKAAVINAANAAKSIINGAKNAQAILDEIPVGITNIDKAYQPGKPHADYVPFNVPTSYNAVKDFDDGIQRNDTSIVYDQNYKNVHSGFNDGIHRLKAEDKASKVYMDGYKMAVDGLAGMKAAKSIDKVDINELSGKSADFNAGFNGYLAGLKAAIKHFEKADTGQGPVYKFTYDEGYKAGQKQAMKQASLAGRKQAKSGKKIPSLKGYSKQYAKAYKQAFNEANKNTDKSYNVISENGIYIHSSAKFSKDNRVRKLKKGAKFSVKRVVKVNGVNRYYISDKEYVTSDPNMVSNQ